MAAGRGEAVPARDGAFVAVWASQVLHHVDDLPRCVAELRRVVRLGGPVMVRGTFEATGALIPWARYFPEAAHIATELAGMSSIWVSREATTRFNSPTSEASPRSLPMASNSSKKSTHGLVRA